MLMLASLMCFALFFVLGQAQTGVLVAHCDNIGYMNLSTDGGHTFTKRVNFQGWGTPAVLFIPDASPLSFVHIHCLNWGGPAGLIATLHYAGRNYSTTQPLQDSVFDLYQPKNGLSHATLTYEPKTSPTWRIRTVAIANDAFWVWNSASHDSMDFQLDFSTFLTFAPSVSPSSNPTAMPSITPSGSPTGVPTLIPSSNPTGVPTLIPSSNPTAMPSITPSGSPTGVPTLMPIDSPTGVPTLIPSGSPTAMPSGTPSISPTGMSSVSPTPGPTTEPTLQSTEEGEAISPLKVSPSVQPTMEPTVEPTMEPTTFKTTNFMTTISAGPLAGGSSTQTGAPSGPPSHMMSTSESLTGAPTGLPTPLPTALRSIVRGIASGHPESDVNFMERWWLSLVIIASLLLTVVVAVFVACLCRKKNLIQQDLDTHYSHRDSNYVQLAASEPQQILVS